MIGLLRALSDKGERAFWRSVWAFAGAGLLVLGPGFLGGAFVELLGRYVPHFAALGAGALAALAGLVLGAIEGLDAAGAGKPRATPTP
jgi:hypothetical protein